MPACADRLVERIVGAGGAEFGPIATGPEALDAAGVRVTSLTGFNEKLSTFSRLRCDSGSNRRNCSISSPKSRHATDKRFRRKQVDDAPTHREFAGLANRASPQIAIARQIGDYSGLADLLAAPSPGRRI